MARKDVDLKMPWGIKRHGKKPFDAPFGQALMWSISSHFYTPDFYKAETADRLVALDDEIFSSRSPEGEWWFWSLMEHWSRVDEPGRAGFEPTSPGGADAWAVRIIASLPQSALEGPDAKDRWSMLLSMDLGHAAVEMASRNPRMWTARDPRGVLLLRKAKVPAVWMGLIESGLDPFAPLPQGQKAKNDKPLWKRVLPQSSSTAPKEGSFREAAEAWLTDRVKEGHPEKENILAHKLKWISAWLTAWPSGATNPALQKEANKAWDEVIRVLRQQPIKWLSHRDVRVGWAQPFLSRVAGQPKRWAKTLKENQKWLSEAGPACAIAVALFDSPFLEKVPESIIDRFLHSPYRDQDKDALIKLAERKVWGNRSPSATKMEAFLNAQEMEVDLPESLATHGHLSSRF